MKEVFVVIQYRDGEMEDSHSYPYGAYNSYHLASLVGKCHGSQRGGKYDPIIFKVKVEDHIKNIFVLETKIDHERFIYDFFTNYKAAKNSAGSSSYKIIKEEIENFHSYNGMQDVDDLHLRLSLYNNQEQAVLRKIYESHLTRFGRK